MFAAWFSARADARGSASFSTKARQNRTDKKHMDTGNGPDPATRVCPRCGEEAGEQRFCGGCGLNLSAQHELPTRSEWEAHAAPDAATRGQPSPGAGPQASDSPATKARSELDSQLSNARDWYQRQPKGGKLAFVLSTTLAVLLVVGVVIGAASSGGGAGGSSSLPAGYATSQQVVNALSTLFHERFSSVEEGSCEIFGPANVPPPVYDCRFKIEGEWHDNIEATGHPDGSINWQDDTSGVQDLRGGNLNT